MRAPLRERPPGPHRVVIVGGGDDAHHERLDP
jgi:hypothetical protein